jgi:hypothetical protein
MSGESEIEFPGLNADETKYFALITANIGGLSGISYCTNAGESSLIPIVTNYSSGIISLKNVLNKGALNYNLTFIMQAGESQFRSIKIDNSNGIVNQGKTENISLTVGNPGILLISSKNSDGKYGLTAMPWGISSLGLSLKYGSDPNYGNTVVIQTRYVMIDKISYQFELSLWRLYS